MRAAPWSEPVGESQKVLFIDLVEDRHHGLLNNLVLQRRDPQRPLPPVGFRNVDSPRRLCPVCAPVDPAVQIG